jgi:hypothetical protein
VGLMDAIRFCDTLSRWVQPPDAENRMSGGVGGITGAIPLSPPNHSSVLRVKQKSSLGGIGIDEITNDLTLVVNAGGKSAIYCGWGI